MSHELAILGGHPVRTAPFHGWPVFDSNEEAALLTVLKSGKWGCLDGEATTRFERRFADYHGARHGIAVSNGTVALRIALLAAGIQAGDEVIVPPYTFLSTASSVIESNATPVFVDIDPEAFNLDPRRIEAAITSRTRMIIPVHFAGQAADMDAIMEIAGRRGLTVIEDAAHAHGARYKGRSVGSLGHMSCFSFQSSKNMSSGEGGIILTSNDALAEACRSVHNCGRADEGPWYMHHRISGNYRLGEFQAAVLDCQLDRLAEQTTTRDRNGRWLAERMRGIPGIRPQCREASTTLHAHHLFLLRYDRSVYGVPRETYLRAMNAEGIPCCNGYPLPLYRQPLFLKKDFGPYTGCLAGRPDFDYGQSDCPVCERVCSGEGGWMTQNIFLGAQQDMEGIAQAMEKIYNNRHELIEANKYQDRPPR